MQLIAVKYQGRKRYRDRTPLRNEWEPGDAKRVPERDAKTLLRFAEFSRADAEDLTEQPGDAEAAIAAQAQREQDERNETESMLMLIDSEIVVKTGMTATITAKVGFAYADGVDSTAVPQDDDYFGTGITVATAGRYRNAASNPSVTLPKEAWLTLTTAVAANAKASEMEIIVFAINEGVA